MRVLWTWTAAAALVVLAGCVEDLPPLGHIVLFIDTDALLPSPPGAAVDPEKPAALFERVRVELFAPGAVDACDRCVREFDLDEAVVRAGASLTVVAADGAGPAPRARLRLFRGAPLGPDPAPESTIELVLQLPEIPAEGGVAVTAFLPTDAVGVPIGTLEAPAPATRGWAGSGHAGDWKPGLRVPCLGEARGGAICIPGGAYWMGNRRTVGLPGQWAADIERLVVLSPFWMDSAEVTVAQLRASGITRVIPWTGKYGSAAVDISDYCTFTSTPHELHDRLPVNCVWRDAAAAYCATQGATLPTEAQLEYAAGDLGSRLHPWGADEPSCEDAVWGRTNNVVPSAPGAVGPCLAPDAIAMPLPLFDAQGTLRPGRDRVELEGGTVFDLAGNVTEWTSDLFNEPLEPCWNRAGSQVLVDPTCTTPGEEGESYVTRGGFWWGPSYLTRAAVRFAQADGAPGIQTGFRCVRPADAR